MTTPALVTTEWLAARLGDPHLRVVDGTWHMPQLRRAARVWWTFWAFGHEAVAGAVAPNLR